MYFIFQRIRRKYNNYNMYNNLYKVNEFIIMNVITRDILKEEDQFIIT